MKPILIHSFNYLKPCAFESRGSNKLKLHRPMITSARRRLRPGGFLTEEESSFEQSTLPQIRDLYLEYAEMCIQYGYLVMFAPVFPVCFVLAAVNNVVEIRGDLAGGDQSRLFTHNTFSPLNLRLDRGKYVLFIGGER